MSIYSAIGPMQWNDPIVDPKTGFPTPAFQRYFQQLFGNSDFLLDNKQDADDDLDSIAALTGTGYAIRTAANAWTTRSITVTVGHLSIANGDGVAGATLLGLPDSGVTAASYTNANITVDAQGRVIAASNGASGTFFTDEAAQDAVGAMVDASLVYVDATPLLQRAALTGDVTAAAGSNATTIANDAVTFGKMLNASAASVLVGRGSASGAGDFQEITLGSGLTMTGTVLSASGGGGGGLPNGDYGDIVVSGSGTVMDIANDAVTYAKMQNASAGNVALTRAAGTSGDYGETALAASRLLGRGSSGDIGAISLNAGLEFNGSVIRQVFSGAKVRKSANLVGQNLTGSPLVTFNSEDYDTDSYHDSSSNTDRLTVPVAGYYSVSGLASIANVATGNFIVMTIQRRNSAGVFQENILIQSIELSVTGTINFCAGPFPAHFDSGDFARMFLTVEADTSTDITTDTWFAIQRLAAD